MKRMSLRDYCKLVNEAAAQLHILQGKEGNLPDSYFDMVVYRLTEDFHRNFMDTVELDGRLKYVVFPMKPSPETQWNFLHGDIPVFEVQWLVQALLGIALCRQALVIHREPKGPEPADSDKRLVRLINQFIRQADPEIILGLTEDKKEESKDG